MIHWLLPLKNVISEGWNVMPRMVTIPLGNKKHVASLGSQSVTKRMKEICVPYKREYFLNPGHPATKEYLMKLVREVVSGYDVDGVHFDYLRYPENAPLFLINMISADIIKDAPWISGAGIISPKLYVIYIKGVKAMKPWVKVVPAR